MPVPEPSSCATRSIAELLDDVKAIVQSVLVTTVEEGCTVPKFVAAAPHAVVSMLLWLSTSSVTFTDELAAWLVAASTTASPTQAGRTRARARERDRNM